MSESQVVLSEIAQTAEHFGNRKEPAVEMMLRLCKERCTGPAKRVTAEEAARMFVNTMWYV